MRTNRRILVNVLFVIWVLGNIATNIMTRNVYYILLSSWSFLIVMGLIFLCSRISRRFNDWLDRTNKNG